MAETTYYVDPDVSGGAGDGSSWANAYSSLNAAEQARDADITGGNAVVFVCGHNGASQTTADTAAVSIVGWITDSDSYVKVTTETADRHLGVWSTTRYRLTVAATYALTISEDYVRIDGLQIAKTSSDADAESPVYVSGQTASNAIWLSNNLIAGDVDVNYSQPCLYVADGDAIITAWNCVAYSSTGKSGTGSVGLLLTGCHSSSAFYGCTFIGASYGVRMSNNVTAIAKNCYFHGATADRSYGTSAGLTTTTCASSSTNFDVDNIAHSTATFTNVTGGTEHYSLVPGSGLIGVGTTLTDDPPGSTLLEVDILNATRTVTWDIGAFEWIATGRTTRNSRSHPLGIRSGTARPMGQTVWG